MKKLIDCTKEEKSRILKQIQRGNFRPDLYVDDTIVIESEKDSWMEALIQGKDRFICFAEGLVPFTIGLNQRAKGLKNLQN